MDRQTAAALYHQQTKYHPSLAGMGHAIDWNNPPAQFKEYPGADRHDLRPYLRPQQAEYSSAEATLRDPNGPFGLPNLSHLLFTTNGVTGIAVGGDQQHYFRAAPSAGALYPTDLYLLSRGHADLPDGVWYFHVRDHSLIEVYPRGLAPGGDEIFARLGAACFNDPVVRDASLALVATAVFWRSAWRYGERAYRRCLLDTGHVLGNFDIVAPRLGLCTTAVGGFIDSEVAELLAIPGDKEGVLGVFPLRELSEYENLQPGPSARPSAPDDGSMNGELILGVHNAGAITRERQTLPIATDTDTGEWLVNPKFEFAPGVKLKPSAEDLNEQIEVAIQRRRSTRQLTGEAITLPQLADILAFSYRADLRLPPAQRPRLFDRSLLETFVVINRVEGVEPGVYWFAPGFMELLKVKPGDASREIYHLSLGQDLARDAAAVVIHTADLKAATERYGSRAYRYLHLDAGHLGQRMNLAAIRTNLGVSGIGGFFDDEVNALLGIPEQELCVYITCLGKPAG